MMDNNQIEEELTNEEKELLDLVTDGVVNLIDKFIDIDS